VRGCRSAVDCVVGSATIALLHVPFRDSWNRGPEYRGLGGVMVKCSAIGRSPECPLRLQLLPI
jgi:hypothetical protein